MSRRPTVEDVPEDDEGDEHQVPTSAANSSDGDLDASVSSDDYDGETSFTIRCFRQGDPTRGAYIHWWGLIGY